MVRSLRLVACLFLMLTAVAAVGGERNRYEPGAPITPTDGVIKLFNGKDMEGLYTWIQDTKYEDPRKVFTVHDGMIHISGDGYGYISTKKAYRDYHLVTEWKWGTKTWPNREDRTKDSGILFHGIGPDGGGSAKPGGIPGQWIASIEAQVQEGGCGDFYFVTGLQEDDTPIPISVTCEVTKNAGGRTVWKKGGERKTFDGSKGEGRFVGWYGRDPDWKDVLGFRGKQDPDYANDWNREEVICKGGHITTIVNGVVVNEGFDASPSAGKIVFQTEKAEVFLRKFELWPLDKAPTYEKK
ncbi:MAG: DUF1080 domain-containing protein [Planctomycetes bacterium]|nr:DUF1080 domain-containing protein [Planctomycetota bacterium]